ncbi:type I glyceraldehyde-3-phosphate dehydrogenase [Pseudoflavitalea rhizosphaerae]|uniref:type I glyceraldehyde-3-phosphate dehydrogenase n=1 Tax=Pseudoflavitalea rhizosphaerae TaxID=1884793 RepID=UPI000F8E4D7A|nr:glyceraldehyde 3-phosphate dehydrogenase NAD-binding domain-containing protein [Pseudoflavitalea rhizosphaerae]
MRIAINGMGRIGRLLFRRLVNHPDLDLVAVNDIMDPANLEYLLRYDSVYGTFPPAMTLENNQLKTGGKSISVFQQSDPTTLPWKELGIDVVLECSGMFTNKAGAGIHLQGGAKKVLLSTTGSADIPLMIFGYNQHALTAETPIVSPGGCMTNCSTHILYILNAIGIESVQLNILHSYTSRQELVDAPHKQFRRGRAAAESIIPVEIDLQTSLEKLFPMMADKIAAVSTRVPVANGAMADFTLQLKNKVTKEEINKLFRTASMNEYKGILEYTEDPLVSLDIKGNTHSVIVDGTLTTVVGNHLKLITWFDNEYGYTSRMIDWLLYMRQL